MKKSPKTDNYYVKKCAEIIELTLDSFGIRARVVEINLSDDTIEFALEIVMGTSTAEIKSHANDLALALAAPDGKVIIQAPIPGRSLIGITMKKPRSLDLDHAPQGYAMIPTNAIEVITFDNVERLRSSIALCFAVVANICMSIAEKIQSPYKVANRSDYSKHIIYDESQPNNSKSL